MAEPRRGELSRNPKIIAAKGRKTVTGKMASKSAQIRVYQRFVFFRSLCSFAPYRYED
jgi:hypothetical protein